MEESSPHYTVLARRFRPQTFGEVVGQQHVATALKNAIQSGRVAHAYLFTGARGVGKTSMARILAKALNCPNFQDGDPCNECEICRGIAAGDDVDVSEIDGASNRGIDDVRTLRANVNVKSMRTRYKLYIIDEVHMLTKDAFNALLKTLEEPPQNVKFVFCTTEPNKLPDTILSRCQRFDFAAIATSDIVTRLQQIAEAEGFVVDQAALELVARRAGGSMRDSQSLFDQLLAFGGEHLSTEDVHNLLGTASDDRLIEIAEALITGRRDALLQHVDDALSSGVQLGELVDQLISYLRDLMVLAAEAENLALLSVSPDNRSHLKGQAARWGLHPVVAALQILADAKTRMFRSSLARAVAETALIRISLLDELQPLDELIESLRTGKPIELPGRNPQGSDSGGPSRVENSMPSATESRSRHRTPPREESGDRRRFDLTSSPEQAATQPVEPRIVEFRSGNEQDLWSQVVSGLHEKLKAHVQPVCGVAIFGPNRLELTFPTSYSFNKQVCERPEVRSQLEAMVAKVAGRAVRISCRIDPQAAQPEAQQQDLQESADADQKRRQQVQADEFVEQAKSVFRAKIVKKVELPPNSDKE